METLLKDKLADFSGKPIIFRTSSLSSQYGF